MTHEELVKELERRVNEHATFYAAAKYFQTTERNLLNVLRAGKTIGPRVLAQMGYKKRVRVDYVEVTK